MKDLILNSDKANFYSKVLRIVFGIIGFFYCWSGIYQLYPTWDLETTALLNILLGAGIIAVVLLNPTFGADIELEITDDFIRITEDGVYTRTAYWHKLQKVSFNRFSLGVHYQSGTSEQFRLPFISSDDYQALHAYLARKSQEHQFKISEKAWWKLFWG